MALLQPLKLLNQLKLHLFAHSNSTRNHSMRAVRTWDGIKYPGFTYYPRPGEIDPPYEPTKLFMLQKMKPWTAATLVQKKILTSVGLGRMVTGAQMVIVKNTADINARLWKVKGLVRIVPITTPDGLPSEENYSACKLDTQGVFRIIPELKTDEARLKATLRHQNNPKTVKQDVWKKEARLRWVTNWEPL